jgi:NADH-quinone oxidoreductase subunit M
MFFTSDLTWLILLPVFGGLLSLVTQERVSRLITLLFASATLLLSMSILFRLALQGYNFGSIAHLQDSIRLPWIDFHASSIVFNVDYFLGIDGLSLPMIILNALLTTLACIAGWKKKRVREYFALLLFLEAGVMGVFLSMDLFLFFLFWEVELVPMFLLIGIWGSDTEKFGMPGRIYSAWKFLLYTFLGSVFMLMGILVLYFNMGGTTASIPYFSSHFLTGVVTIPLFNVTCSLQLLVFLLIFVAFAVKIPMFPFHTWLPDAHTDAPTEVSVILAGVLLKMGAYGLIRICLAFFPDGMQQFAIPLSVFAVINILYGAAICLVQTDMKKLIAYSSISHMGMILLGVSAAAGLGDPAFRLAALTGAALQMFSHGIITGMLFFSVGVMYDHAHTREISAFGGIAKKMPVLSTFFTLAALASLGLPGLAGFVAEYMIFTGSFAVESTITAISVLTMVLTASYLLWLLKRVFFGAFRTQWEHLADVSFRELIPLCTLAVIIICVGIYPKPLIDIITPGVSAVMHFSEVGLVH